jgi:hypothetical protein
VKVAMKKVFCVAAMVFAFNSMGAMAGQSVDVSAEQYVKLVLATGQHDSGYVDAYYGPKEWSKAAEQQTWSKKQIIEKAKVLQIKLPDISTIKAQMDKLRVHYLHKQLTALITHNKALSGGKKLDFDAQSRALYDTEAPHNSFADFDVALAAIDKSMPGKGTLSERVEAFKKQFEIPTDKLSAVFDRAIKECRDRTKAFVQLLGNEQKPLHLHKNTV